MPMFKIVARMVILLVVTGGAMAAEDGVRRYGKCWVPRTGYDGTAQYQGYDCSAPQVTCSSGSFGSKCTVNGMVGTVGPIAGPFQIDQKRAGEAR